MADLKRRLQRLHSLSFLEWRLLIVATFLLPLTAFLLKLFGYQKTQRLMARLIPKKTTVDDSISDMETTGRIARMVDVAADHGIFRTNCLKKALVTWWLLARRGISADIKIGVAKPAGRFDAHAWVEVGGKEVIGGGDSDQRFTRIL